MRPCKLGHRIACKIYAEQRRSYGESRSTIKVGTSKTIRYLSNKMFSTAWQPHENCKLACQRLNLGVTRNTASVVRVEYLFGSMDFPERLENAAFVVSYRTKFRMCILNA